MSHSWIRVGNKTWIHADCLDEVATLTETYIEKEKGGEEVVDYLYSPSNMGADNHLPGDSAGNDTDNRLPD